MSTEILMPALSPTMTEGNLSKWLIKKAAEFATNSPFPKDSELYTDVYL
jgi:pyruvate/2-oxoglutarate dehydrogenase complex dihydrolipoamide acyltransferase (E2) component